MPNTIVYDSFNNGGSAGRYSDSPLAIYQELLRRNVNADHVWTGINPDAFPDSVQSVAPYTPAYEELLSHTDIYVANTFPSHMPTQKPIKLFLQTWHGTPLKRICFDETGHTPALIERLTSQVAMWDVLLSPNRFSTDTFRGAFRYEGEVWETGYPRNDVLNSLQAEALRKRVRSELGIRDGQKVTLYAPTWRDNVVDADGRRGLDLKLDIDALQKELGDDHLLLLRLHYYVAAELNITAPGVKDVSTYPDISELFLAADALITDYSSAMFDFAVTGKPLYFFTYDLAEYRDKVRGFYFDFEAEAPGPLVGTTEELIAALRDSGTEAAYGQRYQAFQERFCHLDDGHATERLVDRLFAAVPL